MNLKMLKIHFHVVPTLVILVCKIAQFLVKSYRFRQLITLFCKVDTLRLLEIYIMFCPPARAKYSFFLGSSSWAIHTFHSQDQTFLMHCSFSGSNHQQHRQAKWKQKANCFRAFKNSSFHKY